MKKTAIAAEIEAQEAKCRKAKEHRGKVEKESAAYYYYDIVIIECNAVIRALKSILPTEQQQIEDAYNSGLGEMKARTMYDELHEHNTAHNYYKSTYSDK